MKKFKVIEWHVWQPLLLVILGVVLANIFDKKTEQLCTWIILLILGLIPFVSIFIRRIIKKIKIGNGLMDPQDFIDTFDSEIIQNIYNLESHKAKLTEALLNNDTCNNIVSKDIIHFCYIQASSSFQKAVSALCPINNIAPKVLSYNKNDIIIYGLIPFPRYRNITRLLTAVYEYLKINKKYIEDIDEGKFIVELNEIAKNNLDIIDRAVLKGLENKEGNHISLQ